MPMERQRKIDWNRGTQLRILRECQLPRDLRGHDGRRVAAATAKAVLRAIDDHGRDAFPFQRTLAIQLNCRRRTIVRAIQALEAASLLIVDRDSRRRSNAYTIVWTELELLCPRSAQPLPTGVASGPGTSGAPSRSLPGSPVVPSPERPVAPYRGRQWPHPHHCTSRPPPEDCDTGSHTGDTGSHTGDTGSPPYNRPRSAQEPPPPLPPHDWSAAAAELRAFGVERTSETIRYAQQRGMTPGDLLDDIRTAAANRTRFTRPAAALASRIRTGDWPAPVVHWREVESQRRAKTAARASQRPRELILAWRASQRADESIRQQLIAAGVDPDDY